MRTTLRLTPLLAILACAACTSGDVDPGDDDTADGDGGAPGPDAAIADDLDARPQVNFSFFVTSLDTMRLQSGSEDGFGGDLGGLAGADAICQTAAANVGFGYKTWRAFLSVTNGPGGGPVNAIDRIGNGPWYDRNARLIANDKAGLLSTRPLGVAQAVNDLTDETGLPLSSIGDTHDVLTGSDAQGTLDDTDPVTTCYDWTSAVGPGTEHTTMCGHSWPAQSGQNWIRAHPVPGCSPGVNLIQNGPGFGDCVGCGGGWGGIYCFALEP